MADMVWRPAFEDVDAERQVVLEEIAMYEDDPQDKVFDVLGEAVFGDHPLGRAIIGRADGDRATRRWRRSRPSTARATSRPTSSWRPPARSTTTTSSRSSRRRCPTRPGRSTPPRAARAPAARRAARALRAQGHRAVPRLPRRPGPRARRRPPLRAARARHDPRRDVVLAPLPGGARAARARLLGLTRSRSQYADTGQVGLYVGTRPENLVEAHGRRRRRARRGCATSRRPPPSSTAPRRTSRAASCSRWSPPRRG